MANQYTSYYLYQKYEKRGSQDWLPCYPNVFSVDGDGTMPLVIKTENDPDCGYTPPTEPIYRWYNIPITTDYVCDVCPAVEYRWTNKDINAYYECVGTDKYYVQKRQYSYDSGSTWNDVVPEETQRGSLYESDSTDCGYIPPIEPQYRTTSGTPYCTGYDLYVDVYSQVSYDGGTSWQITATTATLVEADSTRCGYVAYRWVDSGTTCVGYDKYTRQIKQQSTDGGSTWTNVTPPEYSATTLIEANSRDCGYSPKLYAVYRDGTTYTVDCSSDCILYEGEVKRSDSILDRGKYINMTSAEIGDCVLWIGGSAFSGCVSLSSVTISSNVESIYEKAFAGCTSLSSITIPNGVEHLGGNAFSGCTSLTTVIIPNSVTYMDSFKGCTSLSSVTFETGSSLDEVGGFEYCTSLRTIDIPDSVSGVGGFYSCSSLSSVTFGSNSQLEVIYNQGFEQCINLKEINIPNGVTLIGGGAFKGCESLTNVTIASNVTSIGSNAFSGCTSLSSVTINAVTPPTLGDSYVFADTNNCILYVPCESLEDYRNADRWSAYSQRITGIPPCIEPQYRTTSGTPYCTGYDLYVDVYSQVSYDGGTTWQTTATTITLVESGSTQCGYVHSYLTFVATETGTFKLSGGTVSYSLDSGTTWTSLASNTNSPTVNAGSKIMWKATQSGYSGIGRFSSTGRFTAEGNIMSLLYGDNHNDKTSLSGQSSAFNSLFSGCTGLTSAENLLLPATTLAPSCYFGMFKGCTNLTTAPSILPAATLENTCYYYMFYGCTSLTTAPVLSATNLSGTSQCCEGMFAYCTSLTTAPSLPATTLAMSCYFNMFQGCTSLTTAPSLPATTLATQCYDGMFSGCTSLTTAPELPATTLMQNCYAYMFYGCTNLNYIKCLATNINASGCTNRWVSGVSSSGTFVKPASTDWSSKASVSGIPSGWTVQDA